MHRCRLGFAEFHLRNSRRQCRVARFNVQRILTSTEGSYLQWVVVKRVLKLWKDKCNIEQCTAVDSGLPNFSQEAFPVNAGWNIKCPGKSDKFQSTAMPWHLYARKQKQCESLQHIVEVPSHNWQKWDRGDRTFDLLVSRCILCH